MGFQSPIASICALPLLRETPRFRAAPAGKRLQRSWRVEAREVAGGSWGGICRTQAQRDRAGPCPDGV